MYSGCYSNFETTECCDFNFSDNGEGFEVCNWCGLVSGPHLAPPILLEKEVACTQTWHDIVDACELGFIPKCVCEIAYNLYMDYKRRTTRRLKHLELVAFSIYAALIREKIPRIPQEIEALCGVCRGSISKVEGASGVGVMPAEHHEYTETFCARLNIPFKHVLKIKQLIQACYELRMVRPQCLNALMIYLYSRHVGLNVQIQDISTVCSVSPSTIKKLVRKIDPQKLNNFDLMFSPQ